MLNEISLWTRAEISSDNYNKMGSYQMLGELLVDVQHVPHFQVAAIASRGATVPATNMPAGIEDYRRSLNLGTAVHTVRYKTGGVTYGARRSRRIPTA